MRFLVMRSWDREDNTKRREKLNAETRRAQRRERGESTTEVAEGTKKQWRA